MIYDTHCHLDYFENPIEIALNSFGSGVGFLNTICVEVDKFLPIYEISKSHKNIFCSIGQHPCHHENLKARDISSKMIHFIEQDRISITDKIKAIGETGLDYFRMDSDAIKKTQWELFESHIEIANRFDLPVIIHTRTAKNDTIKMLKNIRPKFALIHCFTEDLDFMNQCLDLGLYISFSGIITFKNSTAIQECAKYCPIDRILIETDAPYLSPEPLRGKKNEPKNIIHTAKFIAQLRNLDLQEFCKVTTQNGISLFKI